MNFFNNCLKIFELTIIKKIKKDYKKKACERYKNLSKEEKEKKRQYGCERYKNLSEDEKQKLVEYRKKYYRMRKIVFIILKNNDLKSSFHEEYDNVLKL